MLAVVLYLAVNIGTNASQQENVALDALHYGVDQEDLMTSNTE